MSGRWRAAAVGHRARRASRDEGHVASLAAAVTFDVARPAVIAVPMRVAERGLAAFLQTVDVRSANLFVLVNAASEVSADAFDQACRLHQETVDAFNRAAGHRAVSMHRFHSTGSTQMGRLRRLMGDALVEHALSQSAEPAVIVCNDVDQLSIAPSYIADVIRALTSGGRAPAAVAGPVRYGWSGAEPCGAGNALRLPELYLFNRINESIYRWAREHRGPGARVWPEGANLAFTMEAYCDAGGFDPEAATGEDDAFGVALDRLAAGSRRWRPVAFLETAWVATDPRRVLAALLAGHAGVEAWSYRRFADTPGSALDSGLLAERCQRSGRLLTSELLSAFDPGRRDAVWERVTRRVGWHVFRSLLFDCRPQRCADVVAIAAATGLELAAAVFDRAERRFEATVDWGRSPILEQLALLSRAA